MQLDKHKDKASEVFEDDLTKPQMIIKKTKTFIAVFRKGGFPLLRDLIRVKTNNGLGLKSNYECWYRKKERRIRKVGKLAYQPLISIVIPVYNVEDELLQECIQSVLDQTYTNWQLCMADDASTWDNVRDFLNRYEDNPKIKITYREENGHISKATNSAIALADGEFIAFMDCDDTIAPNALYEVARKLNENRDYDFIYSDEDKLSEDGKIRKVPHFKPDWSPDTLMSLMYTSHLGVYRKKIVDELGGLRVGYEGAQDYDLTLRFVEKTNRIAHIDKILYHWREREGSTAVNVRAKDYVFDAQKRAKEDALKRRGYTGSVEFVEDAMQFRIHYFPVENPKVSIIIPSKDNYKVLKRCLESIIAKTKYKNYEIIIIDNGSNAANKALYENLCTTNKVNYLYKEEPFNFSAMCNQGAAVSKGNLLLFLNDDTEVIDGEWLERMAGHAVLPYVGAVGAKLYYPDSCILQHCGVHNAFEGPSHIVWKADDKYVYDFGRNRIEYNFCAVTGACLMVERKKFEEVGGFDTNLQVAYNDVDLCFSFLEKGYYNVLRNDACLYHYESLSRGDDMADKSKVKRLISERKILYSKHPDLLHKDAFYNINLRRM